MRMCSWAGVWVAIGALSGAIGVRAGDRAANESTRGDGAPRAAAVAPESHGERIGKTPYEKFTTKDELGREVTYYMSLAPSNAPAPLPLIVYVQGSGYGSHFIKLDDGRIGMVSGASAVYQACKDRARVLFVEKPGCETFAQSKNPGGAADAPEVFRREHTLERWCIAIQGAIKAAQKDQAIDGSRLMVMGHSEGGLVACKLAADNPKVTHAACLSGGGPTQLFDFLDMARSGHFFDQAGATGEERVKYVLDGWAGVMKSPDSADELWMGHPHRRWTTFCATSPVEELLKSKARVYIAQGSADQAVSPSTALVLQATLLSRGRDVTLNWVEGGDHGYAVPTDAGKPDGWNKVMTDAVNWFVGGATATP